MLIRWHKNVITCDMRMGGWKEAINITPYSKSMENISIAGY